MIYFFSLINLYYIHIQVMAHTYTQSHLINPYTLLECYVLLHVNIADAYASICITVLLYYVSQSLMHLHVHISILHDLPPKMLSLSMGLCLHKTNPTYLNLFTVLPSSS